MTKLFQYFSISIFEGNSFERFSQAVEDIYRNDIRKIRVYTSVLRVEDYYNPPSGGVHFPKFCFWENKKYPNKIFFISNYQDGLSSLCNVIHKQISGNLISCSLSNEHNMKYPAYHFHYSNSKYRERDVLVYKEDKWMFYDYGKPLPIENINYYKNRLIKKRLNNDIIEEYLIKLGIDLWNIDKSVDMCITYEQYVW
jgi:hypothetical protein